MLGVRLIRAQNEMETALNTYADVPRECTARASLIAMRFWSTFHDLIFKSYKRIILHTGSTL